MVKVSVIVPAYNESSRIGRTLEALGSVLREMGSSYEIVVVNDGSTDGTASKVRKFMERDKNVRLVSYKRNMGKGYAIRRGFVETTGKYVVFVDSDMDIDPKQMRRYIAALRRADVAIGSKWHPRSKVKVSLMRKLLSRTFYLLAKLLVGIKVSDTQVGLKAFRREALSKILRAQLVKRYAFDVELLAVASLLDLRIMELPVNLQLTHGFRIREIWRMFLDLLGIAYRLRVIKWYQGCLGIKA